MRTLFFIMAMVVSLTCFANSADNSLLIGRWSYTAADAPYGYNRGEIKFSEQEDVLKAVVTTDRGEVKINKITKKEGKYLCSFYVEGAPVELELTIKGGNLSGSATADYSTIDIAFEKIKSCKIQ